MIEAQEPIEEIAKNVEEISAEVTAEAFTDAERALFAGMLPNPYAYGLDGMSKSFHELWGHPQASNVARLDLFETRKAWLAMKEQGGRFEQYLKEEIRDALAKNDSHEAFVNIRMLETLGRLDTDFLLEMLENGTVWNNVDRSLVSKVLNSIAYSGDPAAAKGIIQFIQHVSSDGYTQQENYRTGDYRSAAYHLYGLLGEECAPLLEELAASNTSFGEWWKANNYLTLAWTKNSVTAEEEFDLTKEKLLLQEYETKMQNGEYKDELVSGDDVDPWAKEVVPTLMVNYYGKLNERDSFEKFGNSFESRERKREYPPVKMVVKGSVAYALAAGKDPRLARDVDVYFVTEGDSTDVVIQDFATYEGARERLTAEQFDKLKQFLEENGIADMPVQVVKTSAHVLDSVKLFDDEPQVVLWDKGLDLQKKLIRPLPKEEYDVLQDELNRLEREGGTTPDGYEETLNLAHDIHLYDNRKLIEGELPDYLSPRYGDARLSAALRLVDIGRRFEIPVDNELLKWHERLAEQGTLDIAIPNEGAIVSPSEFVVEEESFSQSRSRRFSSSNNPTRAIDIAFINTAIRKDLLPLMQEEYPLLAGLVTSIQAAGGIREYVRTTYGEVYLGESSISVGAEPLLDIPYTPEEQHGAFRMWKQFDREERKLFGSLRLCMNAYHDAFVDEAEKGKLRSVGEVKNLLVRRQAESLVRGGVEDVEMRENGYRGLLRATRQLQSGDLAERMEYQRLKAQMKQYFYDEKEKDLRKIIVEGLVDLSTSGEDLAIVADFVDIVRTDAGRVKAEKAEKKQILNPEGIHALRALFSLDDENSKKAVFELLANPEIDPRLKKVCLNQLQGWEHFGQFRSDVYRDLDKPAGSVEWKDYAMLYRVEQVANRAVRERLRDVAQNAASQIRNSGTVTETHQKLAPQLSGEFFFPLYSITGGNPEQLAAWSNLVGNAKSQKLRDGLLYSISNLCNADRELVALIYEKIVNTSSPTKEHAILAGRLLKKVHFLRSLEKKQRSNYGYQKNCECDACVGKKKHGEKVAVPTLSEMLEQSQAPSMLESAIDQSLVAGLFEMTGRGDLSADKLQCLFRAWEDPEPVFLYTAELSRRAAQSSGGYDGGRDNPYKKTLELTGDALAHMDPPGLAEWKQWRYFSDDKLVTAQMEGLSREAKEAYSDDDFVDLGEVLVGLMPSDKPRRIQDEVLHVFRHTHEEGGERKSELLRHAPQLSVALQDGAGVEAAIGRDMAGIASLMKKIEEWNTLQVDVVMLEGLPNKLAHWQKIEIDKREKLIELGYTGNETGAELEKAAEVASESGDKELAGKIVKLRPTHIPDVVKKFMDRYNLPTTASAEDIERVSKAVEEQSGRAKNDPEYIAASEKFVKGDAPTVRDWQVAQQELRSAETLLRMCQLTPQLIAFNRLTQGKKKLTIQKSLSSLRDFAKKDGELLSALDRIQGILEEESHGVGKDHLAVIFTDHPLAMLTVGSFPTGAESCQHYTNGDPNLGAYLADASTKMMMLVDLNKLPEEIQRELESAETEEKKMAIFQNYPNAFLTAMVARRLTKVVRDAETRKPQIFLEPVYTSLDRSSTTRLLNAYAVTRLEMKTGVPVVRGGGRKQVEVAESRNGRQYEDGESGGPGGDGGGMGTQMGTYNMPATPLTKADYLL